MNNDDINEYLPSILNPRGVKKQQGDLTLTQNSIISRCSLSLKRKKCLSNAKKVINKTFPLPSKENVLSGCTFKPNVQLNSSLQQNLLERNNVDKDHTIDGISLNFSLTQELQPVIATGKENLEPKSPLRNPLNPPNKTLNSLKKALLNAPNIIEKPQKSESFDKQKDVEVVSIGVSAIEDLTTEKRANSSSPFSFGELAPCNATIEVNNNEGTLIALSSHTELEENMLNNTLSTIIYEVQKPVLSVSFGVANCESVKVCTKNSNIKNIVVSHNHIDDIMNVDCEVEESSRVTVQTYDDDVIQISSEDESPPKKRATVNLEIKKKTSTETPTENSKVLILNTNAIERLSHVIVQPPNYKLVKRKISDRSKFKNNGLKRPVSVTDGKFARGVSLKQKRIDSYLIGVPKACGDRTVVESASDVAVGGKDVCSMSKNSSVAEGAKCERALHKTGRREALSPRALGGRPPLAAQRPRNDSANSASPRKHVDSIQFSLPPKATSTKSSTQKKVIPHHKIVAGTHFAVDAFSYGDIPQVNYYFLTHFHSDHYSGLKKTFNKTLFCSKITAELCISRLGVNSKCIQVINFDEIVHVEGVEVVAVDANHCPGAVMLLFTLPNGKTLLHTGDFRASPHMESYPIFWNKDIHTIYLDSTYCNPRYDFPTQEQCLEMALYLLRQKKLALEKAGKKFSSVLIVCGTYTIGKEKFFMGMARRVGCNVWACPEKDKVLQAVEGRSFGTQPPAACQLHVVPMRDLTHEKLRSYLDSMQGAYSEVVAFKPSGWENGKNSTIEKDLVTIHGIPYSEHSSFSEMIRFVKFLQPKQVIPTVDISGGIRAVQKYFPCPLVGKEASHSQSRLTDYFTTHPPLHVPAVT